MITVYKMLISYLIVWISLKTHAIEGAPKFGHVLLDPLILYESKSNAIQEPESTESSDSYLSNDEAPILRTDTNVKKNKKLCEGYAFNGSKCKEVDGRLLCGYDKNIGGPKTEDSVDLGNGCRERGDRIECGYDKGPYNTGYHLRTKAFDTEVNSEDVGDRILLKHKVAKVKMTQSTQKLEDNPTRQENVSNMRTERNLELPTVNDKNLLKQMKSTIESTSDLKTDFTHGPTDSIVNKNIISISKSATNIPLNFDNTSTLNRVRRLSDSREDTKASKDIGKLDKTNQSKSNEAETANKISNSINKDDVAIEVSKPNNDANVQTKESMPNNKTNVPSMIFNTNNVSDVPRKVSKLHKKAYVTSKMYKSKNKALVPSTIPKSNKKTDATVKVSKPKSNGDMPRKVSKAKSKADEPRKISKSNKNVDEQVKVSKQKNKANVPKKVSKPKNKAKKPRKVSKLKNKGGKPSKIMEKLYKTMCVDKGDSIFCYDVVIKD